MKPKTCIIYINIWDVSLLTTNKNKFSFLFIFISILLEYYSAKKFLMVVSSLTSSLGVNDIAELQDVTLSIKIKKGSCSS